MKWTFLDILSLTFGNFDATLEKTLYSTSFERSKIWQRALAWARVWQHFCTSVQILKNTHFS